MTRSTTCSGTCDPARGTLRCPTSSGRSPRRSAACPDPPGRATRSGLGFVAVACGAGPGQQIEDAAQVAAGDLLAELEAGEQEALTEFRGLAVDLPGCGASGMLHEVAQEDVLVVQADAVAAALRERDITRAHLVGVSYGGPVIETFMLRHPDLIASAVICDSLSDTRPRTFAERLMMLGAEAQPLQLRILPRSWMRAMNRPIYAKRWPLAYEMLSRLFETADLDDLVKQRRVVNAVRLEDVLRSTSVPTLCLVGDYAKLALSMMERVQQAIPNSQLRVIPDSFDPSNLCQPERFTAEVRAWVH